MIAETIKLLNSHTWYGCSENIEIAKGRFSIPKRWSEVREQIKRNRFWLYMKK